MSRDESSGAAGEVGLREATVTEKEQAIWMANRALDVPYADADDDFRTVSRQFLRAIEREAILATALEAARREAARAAIEQCAIEAGERSPEGVSSHTMLGDMWDARIRALASGAAGGGTPSDGQQRD
jgi:hypothetical protein